MYCIKWLVCSESMKSERPTSAWYLSMWDPALKAGLGTGLRCTAQNTRHSVTWVSKGMNMCDFSSVVNMGEDTCCDVLTHPRTRCWVDGFLWGRQRVSVPCSMAERLRRQLQRSSLHSFAGWGPWLCWGSKELSFVFCLSGEQGIDLTQLCSTGDMRVGRNWVYSAFHGTFYHSNNFIDRKFCLNKAQPCHKSDNGKQSAWNIFLISTAGFSHFLPIFSFSCWVPFDSVFRLVKPRMFSFQGVVFYSSLLFSYSTSPAPFFSLHVAFWSNIFLKI